MFMPRWRTRNCLRAGSRVVLSLDNANLPSGRGNWQSGLPEDKVMSWPTLPMCVMFSVKRRHTAMKTTNNIGRLPSYRVCADDLMIKAPPSKNKGVVSEVACFSASLRHCRLVCICNLQFAFHLYCTSAQGSFMFHSAPFLCHYTADYQHAYHSVLG